MSRRSRSRIDEPEMLEIHRQLVEAGVVVPVALGGAEEALWADSDLASLAENRLGDRTDPRHLDMDRRAEWQARATVDRCYPPSARNFETCFWLLEAGERAGTVALASSLLGSPLVRLASLTETVRVETREAVAEALRREGLEVLADDERLARLHFERRDKGGWSDW